MNASSPPADAPTPTIGKELDDRVDSLLGLSFRLLRDLEIFGRRVVRDFFADLLEALLPSFCVLDFMRGRCLLES